jgi:hypothetical protein
VFIPAPAKAGEGKLCDGKDFNLEEDWGLHGRVFSLAYEGRADLINKIYVGDEQLVRLKLYRSTSIGWQSWKKARRGKEQNLTWIPPCQLWTIYSPLLDNPWHIPWLNRFSLSGGGEQGGFGEKPTHPKPPKELIQLGFPGRIERVG